ncbi:hypothetical protein Pelo_4579 [Pelomyxa schiedti]|nr:hypothetical protein Pelo_4579 [Pelomyxa schiedti]
MSNVVDKSLLRVSGVIQVFHYLSTLPPEYPSLQDVIAKIVPDEVISFLHLANGIVSDFLNDRARAVFDSCDRDNDGLLDSKELSEAMKLLRVDPHAEALQSFFNSIGFDPDTLEVGRDLFYHIFPAIAMSSVIIESSSVLNPESESGDSASAASPTPPPTTTSTDMSLPAATTPDVSAPESDESGSVSDIEQEVQEQKNFRKEEITASAESVDIDYSVSHDSSLVLQDDLLDPPTNPNELEEYCRKMKTYVEVKIIFNK